MEFLDKIIAGPCAAESEEQVLKTARQLAEVGIRTFRAGVWKPRTLPGCFEGRGEEALKWLQKVQQETGLEVVTEVATPEHIKLALQYGINHFWIGARTSANPFAVQAIADELRENANESISVMIKNPVNPDVDLWIGAIRRIQQAGIKNVIAVHRGFSSYDSTPFRNKPMWQVAMELKRRMPDVPLYCDPSHIGGEKEMIETISQQALDLGFDGLMIESHCQPEQALSDAQQQITPKKLKEIISRLIVKDNDCKFDELELLRSEIDQLDEELVDIIAKRMKISKKIGAYKKLHNMTVFQSNRYGEILKRITTLARERELNEDCIKAIMETIHEESVKQQI